MIKKFTTFLASMVALLALSFNASAQSVTTDGLQKGPNDGLYMLVLNKGVSGDQGVLALNADDELILVDPTDRTYDLQSKLWCITVTGQTGNSNAATFQFVNQGTGLPLAVSVSDFTDNVNFSDRPAVTAGGNLGEWYFSETYLPTVAPYNGAGLQTNQPLSLSFRDDYVLGITYSSTDGFQLRALKGTRTDVVADLGDGTGVDQFAQITIANADDYNLSADEFNKVLGNQAATKGVELTFTPDVLGGFVNPFNETVIFAEESGDGEYLNIVKGTGANKKYLAVAKKYTNETSSGNKYLAWEWNNSPITNAIGATGDAIYEEGRSRFILTYSPSEDKLYIRVKNVFYLAGVSNNVETWNVVRYDALAEDNTLAGTPLYNLYVATQDLANQTTGIVDNRLLTINTFSRTENGVSKAINIYGPAKADQNTKVTFVNLSCKLGDTDRTTIYDGVYHIMKADASATGLRYYLASPIYQNGADVEWMDIDPADQNPAHMPAYQWVVLQNTVGDAYSAVSITNREFDDVANTYNYQGIRFVKTNKKDADGNEILTAIGNYTNLTNVVFVKVGAEALNNPKVGYGFFAEDSLLTSKYLFNYFNPLDQSTYLGLPSKQNVLSVLPEEPGAFTVESYKEDWYVNGVLTNADTTYIRPYGFTVTDAIAKRIPGLVQLQRTPYTISVRNKGLYNKISDDTYYGIVDKTSNNIYVYFKENNHYDNNHYYAFVEVADYSTTNNVTTIYDDALGLVKAGVDDAGLGARLKVEELGEKRTSSFAVIADDRPLYRRFNGVGADRDQESAGDRRDTLTFKEVYRGEVLGIEANPEFNANKGIADVLGIDYADKFLARDPNAKFGFVVDTAWVERGRGVVKPQYLISIERNDYLGSPETLCPIDPSPEHQAVCHHYRPSIPAFNRGKYLVNYEGLRAQYGTHYSDVYMWNDKYHRAGFVHAIHRGDSLYVLLADKYDFYNSELTNETIDFATIVKEGEAVFAPADEHKRAVKIFPLVGDKHKYVTWSMRYVNPDEWYTQSDFLIESMKEAGDYDIAPSAAEWLKSNNGVLVLSVADESTFENAQTGGDDALIFNIESGVESGVATDNDKVTTTEVKVIAAEGKITVLNAAGKKVVVSNVLGQTVANTVLSSDNASIAAPKGIVVVAVEGEDAVKAIVK